MYAYSLYCSSFFWFNQIYIKDPKRQPPERNYNGAYRYMLLFLFCPAQGWELGRKVKPDSSPYQDRLHVVPFYGYLSSLSKDPNHKVSHPARRYYM